MKPRPVKYIKAELSASASSKPCFPLGAKTPLRRKWAASSKLYLGEIAGTCYHGERVLCTAMQVDRDGYPVTPVRAELMDAVTGSIYDVRSGRCLSSDNLRLTQLVRFQAKGERILLAMRAPEP